MENYTLEGLCQGSEESEVDSHGTASTGRTGKNNPHSFSENVDLLSETPNLPTIEFIIIHHDFNHMQSKASNGTVRYCLWSLTEKISRKVMEKSWEKPKVQYEYFTIFTEYFVLLMKKEILTKEKKSGHLNAVLFIYMTIKKMKFLNSNLKFENLATKNLPVRFLVKDSTDGQSPSNEELEHAMTQIPGLIMSCDPADVMPNETVISQISINFGANEIVTVNKKAVDTYRKLSNVKGPLKAQREKCYMQINDKTVAVSKIRLFPEKGSQVKFENSVAPKEVKNSEKKLPLFPDKGFQIKVDSYEAPKEMDKTINSIPVKRKRGRPRKQIQLENENCTYRNEINDAQSMDTDVELQLDELKRELNRSNKNKNISQFPVEENIWLRESEQHSDETALGNDSGMVILPSVEGLEDSSSSGGNIETYVQAEPQEDVLVKMKPSPSILSENMTMQKLWMYIMDCVTSDPDLDVSSFTVEKKNWLEIKRRQDYLEIDYEVVPAVTVKAVQDGTMGIQYFIRSHGRLIKKGKFISAHDVNSIIFCCLSEDRKTCLGMNPTYYLQKKEYNEQLTNIIKIKGKLIKSPFDGLFSNSCYGIVRINPKAPSTRFKRGDQSLFGIQARCTACCKLKQQMDREINSSAGMSSDVKVSLGRQSVFLERSNTYGSSSASKMKINHILTDNVSDILGIPQVTIQSHMGGSIGNDVSTSSTKRQRLQKKRLQNNAEASDKSFSNINISEDEFIGIIALTHAISRKAETIATMHSQGICQYLKYGQQLPDFFHTRIMVHIGSLQEKCGDRQVPLSNKESLYIHKKQIHTERSPFCTVCNMDFTTRDQLFDHMNKHRNHHPFQCTFCDHKLTNMDAYKKHVRISHKIKSVKELKLNCKTCNIHFYTADHLLLHRVNQNHADIEQFICKFCRFSCNTANDFRSHVWDHSEDEREASNMVICLHCHKVFFSTFRLNYHVEMKHTKEKQKEKNKEADMSVNNQFLLESEKKKKNKGPYLRYLRANSKYECKKCRRRFKTQETLNNHDKFSHGGKKSRMIKPQFLRTECECSLCGRKFNGLRKLATHMKIHAGNKPVFQCEECGQIYGKKLQVLEHIRNDHAEQVQRHQEQQQQSGHQLVTCGPPEQIIEIQGAQLPLSVSASGTVSLPTAMLEAASASGSSASWSPIKSPFKVSSVEQTQEAVYSLLQLTDF
ncbi:unnamed protein product, partial [Meganyctiphanes norvegica]